MTLGVLLGGWAARGQGPPPAPEAFQGKYLLVYKKSDPSYSITLAKVEVQKLGDVAFLVGTGADDGNPDNWQAGLTIWVALDDVSEFTVFESLDDLKDTLGGLDLKVASHAGHRSPDARPRIERIADRPPPGP